MTDKVYRYRTFSHSHYAAEQQQIFHGSALPYIVQLASDALTNWSEVKVREERPVCHAQVQEALLAMRQQAITLPNPQGRRIGRTLTAMRKDTLYHAPLQHCRIALDPDMPLDTAVSIDHGVLNIVALSGETLTIALDTLDAWRVDDSWSYMTERGVDTPNGRDQASILNDIDHMLQLPYGLTTLKIQRPAHLKKDRRAAGTNLDALTPLLSEYWRAVERDNGAAEMAIRRIQMVPVQHNVLPNSSGPFAMVANTATLSDSMAEQGEWVRITKQDGLPFTLRRAALKECQLQDVRYILDRTATAVCDNSRVIVLDTKTF